MIEQSLKSLFVTLCKLHRALKIRGKMDFRRLFDVVCNRIFQVLWSQSPICNVIQAGPFTKKGKA
jgi:bacteriorhodopsin